MPKAFRRLLKNYQKKFKLSNTHLGSFYLQKYVIAIVVNKFLISIFLIKHCRQSLNLNYIKLAIYEIL